MTSAADKAAAYDRAYGGSVDDFGQKVERQERIELRERKAGGGRRTKYVTVPELPWKRSQS